MLQIALSRLLLFFLSRWKDWRDKVAAELRQSVRSSTLYSLPEFAYFISVP